MSGMSDRENRLRSYRFQSPEQIPVRVGMWGACLLPENYDQERLWEILDAYPRVSAGTWRPQPEDHPLTFAPWASAGKRYIDPFGCVWTSHEEGATGQVVEHPLEDWAAFASWTAPNPEESDGRQALDWNERLAALKKKRETGQLVRASLPHGHTFLRLCDLRGYQNLIYDMIDAPPELERLIAVVTEFNRAVVQHCLRAEPDLMAYPEDLGMQVGPMLGPDQFRRWIVPAYKQIMAPAREAGCLVHMHSDGDIRSLFDDLCDCGVQIINCQEDACTLDWLKREVKGRVAIDLGLSARRISTDEPAALRDYILGCAEELSMPEGGLSLGCQFAPGVPWENLETLYQTLDELGQ